MRRGEVRWYTFRAPDKRRPVLILTRDSAIGYRKTPQDQTSKVLDVT